MDNPTTRKEGYEEVVGLLLGYHSNLTLDGITRRNLAAHLFTDRGYLLPVWASLRLDGQIAPMLRVEDFFQALDISMAQLHRLGTLLHHAEEEEEDTDLIYDDEEGPFSLSERISTAVRDAMRQHYGVHYFLDLRADLASAVKPKLAEQSAKLAEFTAAWDAYQAKREVWRQEIAAAEALFRSVLPRPISHPEPEIIVRYFHGETTGEEESYVEFHVPLCESCKWELEALSRSEEVEE